MDGEASDIGLKVGSSWFSVRKLMENNMRIIDKRKQAGLIRLNEAQEKFYHEICKALRDSVPARFIILKARQLGFTTFIRCFTLVMTLFRANQDAIIMANTEANATAIFDEYKRTFDEIGKHNSTLTFSLQSRNGRILQTKNTKSSIRVAPPTEDAVRGTTPTCFHGSECSRWDNMDDIIAAVVDGIPAPADNPVTFVFLESTANGMNEFKDYWDKAMAKENIYIPLFFPWFINKAYAQPYSGFELTDYEKEQKEKYGLSNAQIAFFRYQFVTHNKNLKLTLQEYPFCASDAFITSGTGVFDNELIGKRKEEVAKIKPINGFYRYKIRSVQSDIEDWSMSEIKFVEGEFGSVKVFEEPMKGVPYVIGVDMSEGVGNDRSVAFVIRNDTKKEVAIFASNSIAPEKFALEVHAIAKSYNNALVSIEVQRGGTAIATFKKLNYENLYIRDRDEANIQDSLSGMYGFKTTQATKQMAIDIFKRYCEEDDHPYSIIMDYETLTEMETFVYEYGLNRDTPKLAAAGKKHDDRVMAAAIAYYTSRQETTLVSEEVINKTNELPWQLRSDEEDNEESDEVENLWRRITI